MKPALIQEYTGRRLTAFGWFVILSLIIAFLWGFVENLYPFLAPNKPPHRGLLVVEGWIDDEALAQAVQIYRTGNYSKIVCSGVPIDTGNCLLPFNTYSEMTAARLLKQGIDPSEIITAIGKKEKKDRTYLSALALRDALRDHHITETNLHLVTTGPHGRRSLLLFKKALGKEYHIGVTCLADSGYDPAHWYLYSQGVRKVIDEFIACIYAQFFFHPSSSVDTERPPQNELD